mgnify:CR=1 FL=1
MNTWRVPISRTPPVSPSPSRWKSWPEKRVSGRLGRWLILSLLLVSACAPALGPSPYRVTPPQLKSYPLRVECKVDGRPAECVMLLMEDFRAIVIELKAACLALNGSEDACQAR